MKFFQHVFILPHRDEPFNGPFTSISIILDMFGSLRRLTHAVGCYAEESKGSQLQPFFRRRRRAGSRATVRQLKSMMITYFIRMKHVYAEKGLVWMWNVESTERTLGGSN